MGSTDVIIYMHCCDSDDFVSLQRFVLLEGQTRKFECLMHSMNGDGKNNWKSYFTEQKSRLLLC